MDQTGFDGDGFDGHLVHGVWAGIVVDRDDPDRRGRIRVRVPGIIETESTWALPRAGGSAKRGRVDVPVVGADVFIQFLGGRIDQPIWEPGPHGIDEIFPEHEDPDISVFGIGPFRLVIDNRTSVQQATFKIVKTVGDSEEDICSLLFDALGNGVKLYATTAIQLSSEGLIDIDCAGDVQIHGRKILKTDRAVS